MESNASVQSTTEHTAEVESTTETEHVENTAEDAAYVADEARQEAADLAVEESVEEGSDLAVARDLKLSAELDAESWDETVEEIDERFDLGVQRLHQSSDVDIGLEERVKSWRSGLYQQR